MADNREMEERMSYQIDLCFFREGEQREWGEFLCEERDIATYGLAYERARELATKERALLELMLQLRYEEYDGVSVDVRQMADPEPHAYEACFEVVPGRRLDAWHGDECHEPVRNKYLVEYSIKVSTCRTITAESAEQAKEIADAMLYDPKKGDDYWQGITESMDNDFENFRRKYCEVEVLEEAPEDYEADNE